MTSQSSKGEQKEVQASLGDVDALLPVNEPEVKVQTDAPTDGNVRSIRNRFLAMRSSSMDDSIAEDYALARSYEGVSVLEVTHLPRGGVSVETSGAGRIQVRLLPFCCRISPVSQPRMYHHFL